MLERVWRKGNPLTLLVAMQTCAATTENGMEVPQKTENRTITQPSNSISRFLDKENKTLIQNNIWEPSYTVGGNAN